MGSQARRDWEAEARQLFRCPKPSHFLDPRHCCECYEHDQTLCAGDVDSIGFAELGNPAWDPLCGCSVEGFHYYFPALVRLCLASSDEHCYLDQFLFHLHWDGPGNRLVQGFDAEQRRFVVAFLEYLIETQAHWLDWSFCADEVFAVLEIWRDADQ